jgi:hypothetical protein
MGLHAEKALGCWDKVFNTTYFSERGEEEARGILCRTDRNVCRSYRP